MRYRITALTNLRNGDHGVGVAGTRDTAVNMATEWWSRWGRAYDALEVVDCDTDESVFLIETTPDDNGCNCENRYCESGHWDDNTEYNRAVQHAGPNDDIDDLWVDTTCPNRGVVRTAFIGHVCIACSTFDDPDSLRQMTRTVGVT